jgi:hypothetical protein
MSQDQHLKQPIYRTLTDGIRGRINDAVQLTGKSLPCHVVAVFGALITVQFDISSQYTLPTVTIPLFGPEYIRYPIKAGDRGMVIPCDARLDYTSGQSNAIAGIDAETTGNLSAIFFMPIGNKNWVAVDPTQVTIYAPNGVLIRDTASAAKVNIKPGSITVTLGSSEWQMTANAVTVTTTTYTVNAPTIVLNGNLTQGTSGSGYPATLQGPITVIHEVTANGTPVSSHVHGGVQTGSGDTGIPIP